MRGCGVRQAGGLYLTVPLAPFGHPVEEFICDSPLPLDAQRLGLSPVGTHLIQSADATILFDWIGEEHYPSPADFVEEVRAQGLSRRLSRTADLPQLQPGGFLVLVHRRAQLTDWHAYASQWSRSGGPPCPHEIGWAHCQRASGGHLSHCAALWWHDVAAAPLADDAGLPFRRSHPGASYLAWYRPLGAQPTYRLGAIMRFPLGAARLEVVNDPVGGEHRDTIRRAATSGLPVELVEE